MIFTILLFIFVSLPIYGDISKEEVNEVRIGVPSKLENADPAKTWHIFESFLTNSYCSTLTQLNERGEITGHLLKSWEISKDLKTYTFELRKNVKFHDGSELKVDDVFYSLSRHFWKSSKSLSIDYLRHAFGRIPKVEDGATLPLLKKNNDYKFTFFLEKPYLPLLNLLAMSSLCIVKEDRPEFGTGPMLVKRNTNGWDLIAFKDYFFERKPYLQKISLTSIFKSNEALMKLKNSEIDLIIGNYGSLSGLDISMKGSIEYTSLNHFFINKSGTNLEKKSVRKFLGQLLQSVAWAPGNYPAHQKPTSYILPLESYAVLDQSETKADNFERSSVELLQSSIEPIRFVFLKNLFLDKFYKKLSKELNKLSIKHEILLVDAPDYRKLTDSRSFDVTNLPTTLGFHDPDGLFLVTDSFFSKEGYSSKNHIGNGRHLKDKISRVRKYRDLLKLYKSDWVIVPGFEMSIPYLSVAEIQMPKTKFRNYIEIWKIEKSGDRR